MWAREVLLPWNPPELHGKTIATCKSQFIQITGLSSRDTLTLTHSHTYTHTRTHTYTLVLSLTHSHVLVQTRAHTHALKPSHSALIHTYTLTLTLTYTRSHILTKADTHSFTHTHIHTHAPWFSPQSLSFEEKDPESAGMGSRSELPCSDPAGCMSAYTPSVMTWFPVLLNGAEKQAHWSRRGYQVVLSVAPL